MAKRWYVVHAYSGFEKHVMRSLQERVKLAGMEDEFGEILVPTEEVVEMRAGQKRRSERKFFPGYVLVHMEMNDDSWHMVKETPKVMGFIGEDPKNPGRVSPITQKEADAILRRMDDAVDLTHAPPYSTQAGLQLSTGLDGGPGIAGITHFDLDLRDQDGGEGGDYLRSFGVEAQIDGGMAPSQVLAEVTTSSVIELGTMHFAPEGHAPIQLPFAAMHKTI